MEEEEIFEETFNTKINKTSKKDYDCFTCPCRKLCDEINGVDSCETLRESYEE